MILKMISYVKNEKNYKRSQWIFDAFGIDLGFNFYGDNDRFNQKSCFRFWGIGCCINRKGFLHC